MKSNFKIGCLDRTARRINIISKSEITNWNFDLPTIKENIN